MNHKICVCCYIRKEEDCFPIKNNKLCGTCKACKIIQRNKSMEKNVHKYIARERYSRYSSPIKAMYHHYRNLPTRFLSQGFKSYECIIGIDHQGFKDYMESKFKPWMSWNNRQVGSGTCQKPFTVWTIDHIIPIKTGCSEDELIQLSHYTNLQPCCSYINNRIKRYDKDYYNIESWNQKGYWTEVMNGKLEIWYKAIKLDVVCVDNFTSSDILDVWERHRVMEYMRQVS